MKYYNYNIVFQEIPDETTLAINISGCPCHCEGCHSPFLWKDQGTELTMQEYERLLNTVVEDITCVCFMGGDANPEFINALAKFTSNNYPFLKIGWYTGRKKISSSIDLTWFDYIKVGPYVKALGGLSSKNTNQAMYKILHYPLRLENITHKFQK